MIEQIKALHACWNQTTGQSVNLRATERIWFELANLDFTADDLLSVLKHVLQYNKTHASCPMKIQAHKLCEPETFASICGEAKARERNRVKPATPKDIILHEFRGITPEPCVKPRHVSEVFEQMRKENP